MSHASRNNSVVESTHDLDGEDDASTTCPGRGGRRAAKGRTARKRKSCEMDVSSGAITGNPSKVVSLIAHGQTNFLLSGQPRD